MVAPNDPLGVSTADLDGAIDALFEPPMPAPPAPLEFEPPAIVEHLPSETYHADMDSVGAGGLRELARSPLHHWWANRRPPREVKEPTPSQRLGTAIHAAVLEPERFASDFAVAPDVDRRFKAGKEAYAEFLESIGDAEIISASDHATALIIAQRVHESALGRMFFEGETRTELSVYWTDRATGVRCRIRPDLVPSGHPVLVDLKSCSSAQDVRFRNAAWDWGYHVTAAFYVDGWKAATGEKRDYVFAAWEKEEPYANAWYFAEDEVLEAGRTEYRRLLRIYAECLDSDNWPGYSEQLQPLLLPPWAMDKS